MHKLSNWSFITHTIHYLGQTVCFRRLEFGSQTTNSFYKLSLTASPTDNKYFSGLRKVFRQLIQTLSESHLQWIDDWKNASKKQLYRSHSKELQAMDTLRTIQYQVLCWHFNILGDIIHSTTDVCSWQVGSNLLKNQTNNTSKLTNFW